MAQEISSIPAEQAITRIEEILGYTFTNKSLVEAALTHPSATGHGELSRNYERLEFLGDSILGAIVARELFCRFTDIDEGGLTRVKVSLVAGSMLARVAEEYGIGEAIIFGESETGTDRRGLHSALENVYEALVAALFLDGGLDAARAWVERSLFPNINKDLATEPESPKSSLQEFLQAQQKSPVYEITGSDGPPHDRVFFARVLVDGEVEGEGSGRSKKEAEAQAAAAALDKLGVSS